MRTKFEQELTALHELLIHMASLAESSIQATVEALESFDEQKAKHIVENDDNIDQMEKEIERRCLRLLLQQQPVACDLRDVSTALKMVTDLERIGDQAADIAEVTVFLCKGTCCIPNGLLTMAAATTQMVRGAIDAFVQRDMEKAKAVIAYDDVVDRDFLQTRDELIEAIQKSDIDAQQMMDLLMIAKYFERIGDHAVNIAEWAVFSLTGLHKNSSVI